MKKDAILSISTKFILFSIVFVQIRTDAMSQINKIAPLGTKSLLSIYLRSQKPYLNNPFRLKDVAHYYTQSSQSTDWLKIEEFKLIRKLQQKYKKYNWSDRDIQEFLSFINKTPRRLSHQTPYQWPGHINSCIITTIKPNEMLQLLACSNLLHMVVQQGDLESVKAILESDVGSCLINVFDEKEMTPLLLAAQLPNEEIFKELVKNGADKSQILKISNECIKNNAAHQLFLKEHLFLKREAILQDIFLGVFLLGATFYLWQ